MKKDTRTAKELNLSEKSPITGDSVVNESKGNQRPTGNKVEKVSANGHKFTIK